LDQDSHKNNLKCQIREAYGRVTYTSTTHVKQSETFKEYDTYLKCGMIVSSIITTGGIVSFFINDNIQCLFIGVAMSTLTMILSSLIKSIDYGNQSAIHNDVSNKLWKIREEYVSLLIDFDSLDESDIIKKRDDLQERTHLIYSKAPTTSDRNYKKAQRVLQFEEEQYFSDDDLDQLLPKCLRTKK